MTPEAQQIAMAEACGWRSNQCGENSSTPGMWRLVPPQVNAIIGERFHTKEEAFNAYIPDYLNDLNAMHEAENAALDEREEEYYRGELAKLTHPNASLVFIWKATAAQRVEAILRTKGLWT